MIEFESRLSSFIAITSADQARIKDFSEGGGKLLEIALAPGVYG